ncbi:AgmX/PglI C-terminal domain-containing protein [Tamilnaduibacter salinus]|uniref:AgmX/PglI C-terminal domain-containing protein n=1 Tax=Tamilnaduibacter salinus TaxID=1484056 RepID=UPI001D171E40|nr:AgmX/PglI C-terminal domain-containing protein [Tamilnaduibacter salinus]
MADPVARPSSMDTAWATRLPWQPEPGESRRLYVCLTVLFLLFLPAALWIPRLELPDPRPARVDTPEPQQARLLESTPEPESKPEPEPEPEPKPTEKPEPAEPTVVERPQTPPEPAEDSSTEQTVSQARERASQSGLLAMQDQLSAMQELESPEDSGSEHLKANVDTADASAESPGESGDVTQGSDGVGDGAAAQETVALAEHQTRTVEAPDEPSATASAPAPDAEPAVSGPGQRPMNDIRRTFDRRKSVLYALYNRQLRRDPSLSGEVMLEVVIEPNGQVSDCRIVRSELDSPTLEQKIVNRVRLFNFGKADVEERTVRFSYEFLPS